MTRSIWTMSLAAVSVLVATAWFVEAVAQPTGAEVRKPGLMMDGKEVTLTGRLVDLHCAMTGKYPSADKTQCTEQCLRAGVTPALETEGGLVILGKGMTSPARMLADHAFQDIKVTGKLYEKAGLRYLDYATATPTIERMPSRTIDDDGDHDGDHDSDE